MEQLLITLVILIIINVSSLIHMLRFHQQINAMPVLFIMLSIFGADIGLIAILLIVIVLIFNGFDIQNSKLIKTLVQLAIIFLSISIFSCCFNIKRAKKILKINDI
jgi:hypothetical protein